MIIIFKEIVPCCGVVEVVPGICERLLQLLINYVGRIVCSGNINYVTNRWPESQRSAKIRQYFEELITSSSI